METITKITTTLLKFVFFFKDGYKDWKPDFTIGLIIFSSVIFLGQLFVTLFYIDDILEKNKVAKKDSLQATLALTMFFFKSMFWGLFIYFAIMFVIMQLSIYAFVAFIAYTIIFIIASLVGDGTGFSAYGLTRSFYEQYRKKIKNIAIISKYKDNYEIVRNHTIDNITTT